MNGNGWNDTDVEKLRRLHSQSKTSREIAAQLGRSQDSVLAKLKRLRESAPPAVIKMPRGEREKLSDSSLRSEVERLTRLVSELQDSGKPKRVEVETAAEVPQDPQDLWYKAEEDSARRIDYARERGRFKVRFPENLPIGVSFVSDQHIAPGTPVDFRRMREDAELIKETDGLYACLGGDGVDNHIKIRPAALAARSQPHEQWELFEWYLSIFAEKIVALISGNHDAWTDQLAGIDMVARIAKSQKIAYCPAEARINMTVGAQVYDIAFRHQYRFNSSINQGHSPKQWWRFGDASFDVGCVCHHHESHIEDFHAHGLKRWVCRPGSYQYTSAFGRQYGFTPNDASCPTFVFWPDRRRIMGFDDLRDAVDFLKVLRAG